MTFTPYDLDPNLDLALVRDVDVAPELVWRAWTEPELLKQWFTPRPWTTPVAEVDLRVGGGFHTVMRGPDGEEHDNSGCYLEVVPNQRLVWTAALAPGFRPVASELPLTAIIELEAMPSGGTRYRAIAMHQNPADRKVHDEMGFADGWGTVLDQLVELVKTI
jgi:uncharacterized protein YndB with AHSA1/START domain